MPKRQAAREKARATVEAAAASAQPASVFTDERPGLPVRVSLDRREALKGLAQGRSLDAIVADAIDAYVRRNHVPL